MSEKSLADALRKYKTLVSNFNSAYKKCLMCLNVGNTERADHFSRECDKITAAMHDLENTLESHGYAIAFQSSEPKIIPYYC